MLKRSLRNREQWIQIKMGRMIKPQELLNAFENIYLKRFSPFKNAFTLLPISNVTPMDDTGIFSNAYYDEDVGVEADLNNLETTINVSPIPTTRIDKDHPKDQIIRDFNSSIQTRRMTKITDEHAMSSGRSKLIEAMPSRATAISTSEGWTTVNLINGPEGPLDPMVFRNKKMKRRNFQVLSLNNSTTISSWCEKDL
ncbi:hypothetical protein Tco_1385312 [Tanacetum coccineum]